MAQLTKNNKRSIKSTWREINWHVEGSAERHALRAQGATFPAFLLPGPPGPPPCPSSPGHRHAPGHGAVTLGPGSTRVPPPDSTCVPPGHRRGRAGSTRSPKHLAELPRHSQQGTVMSPRDGGR